MAASGQTLVERISRWDTLITNLEPELAEMAHLAPDLNRLKEILLRSRELEHLQDAMRAQSQDNTVTRTNLVNEGDRLRRRIGAGLQSKLGFGSETLLKFGFRPRRQPLRPKRKKQNAPNVTNVSPEA